MSKTPAPVGEGWDEPVHVRRLAAQDWADLRSVRLAMLLDTPLAYGSTYEREREYPEQLWRERAEGLTWMAFSGTRPVGSVTLYADPDRPPGEIWLVGMWVAAHARGSGAAQALVEVAVAQARADGLERVVLEVAENNPRARAAYSRMGFVETGEAGPSSTYPRVCELEMVRYLTG